MSPDAMVLVLVFIFHGDIRTAFVGLEGKECRLLGIEVEAVDVDAERNGVGISLLVISAVFWED